jgi:predicted Zn-dependent protease
VYLQHYKTPMSDISENLILPPSLTRPKVLALVCALMAVFFLCMVAFVPASSGQASSPINGEQTGIELYRAGDCAAAVEHLAGIAGRSMLLAANCYLQLRDYTKAQDLLQKYLAGAPDDVRAIALLSRAYCASGTCDAAISVVQNALNKKPQEPELMNALASACAEAGDVKAAADLWKQVLNLNPDDPVALTGVGRLAFQSSAIKQAGELFARAIAVAPDFIPAYAGIGRVLMAQGDMTNAIPPLQRAFISLPSDRGVAKDLARAYMQSKRWDAVLSTVEESDFRVNADDEITGWYAQANAYVNDAARAEAYYRASIQGSPHNMLLHLLLADLLYNGGKTADAKEEYRNAISAAAGIARPDKSTRITLGRALFRNDSFVEARQMLRPVLAEDPQNKDALYLLAQIAAKQKSWAEATTYSNLLLLDDPKNLVLLHILADAALSQDLDVDAARFLERLIELDPKDKSVRLRLVVLYSNHQKLGQLSRAFDLLNDVIAANPDDPESLLLLANLYRKNDQPDKARELFLKGFDKLPAEIPRSYSWAFNSYGLLLFQQNAYADALNYQEKAVQLDPNDEEANYNLALTYLKVGKRDELLNVLEHLRSLQSSLVKDLEQVLDRSGVKYPK